MKISIHPSLNDVLRIGVLRIDNIQLPLDEGEALWNEIERKCDEIAQRYNGMTPGQIPEVKETRSLYRAVGLEPTKTRPSSEALLRRIIKGKGLYRILPLVDLFNLASVTSQLSVGLYDEAKIVGETVTVQLGDAGWSYEGIGRGTINVGSRLCVVDAHGPFGSPTADSLRTSISRDTNRALAIFFAPKNGDRKRLSFVMKLASTLAKQHVCGEIAEEQIIEC